MQKNSLKIFTIIVISFLYSHYTRADTRTQLEIESGKISGIRSDNGVDSYLGIPYAQAPSGALRWKAPRKVLPWRDVLDTNKLPVSCPQIGNWFSNSPASDFGKPVGKEDCLFLNIWTRSENTPESKLPVVVWIHGGSNFKGTSSDPMYDGTYLANTSKVVMVSVNYRLGLLGAISYDALQSGTNKIDDGGNFTTLDLVQALKWVKTNIQNFGGDVNNVTIMGQSAGCVNVWGLLQTPFSDGLFHKAVCSSGLPNIYPKSIAKSRAQEFVENLIINANYAKDRKEAEKFLASREKTWVHNFLYSRSSKDISKAGNFIVPYQHIEDNLVFPAGLEATAMGKYKKVPMIIGSTIDEGTFLLGSNYFKPDLATLWGFMQNTPADLKFDDVITTNYPAYVTATKAASLSFDRTISNIYLTAKLHNKETFRYLFDWDETPAPWKDIFGSIHGMDAIFYLGNFETQKENFLRFAWSDQNRESREKLREEMNKHFTQFFHSGNPGWKSSKRFH